jgi:hypothetical protein
MGHGNLYVCMFRLLIAAKNMTRLTIKNSI